MMPATMTTKLDSLSEGYSHFTKGSKMAGKIADIEHANTNFIRPESMKTVNSHFLYQTYVKNM